VRSVIGTSLITPIVYGLWTMGHGALSNWYPYPFVNATKLGHHGVLMNMAGFLGAFVAVALALVVVDRILGSIQRRGIVEADQQGSR